MTWFNLSFNYYFIDEIILLDNKSLLTVKAGFNAEDCRFSLSWCKHLMRVQKVQSPHFDLRWSDSGFWLSEATVSGYFVHPTIAIALSLVVARSKCPGAEFSSCFFSVKLTYFLGMSVVVSVTLFCLLRKANILNIFGDWGLLLFSL